MADTVFPGGGWHSTDRGIPLEDSPEVVRVRRLKQRFLWAWNHPKWARWRQEAKEDYDFVSGVGQWPEGARRRLESQGRPALTINRTRAIIQTVIGYERSARLEPKPVPQTIGKTPPEEETLDTVSVFGRLLKRVSIDQEAEFVQSEGFKDGVVTGLGVWYVAIDYADDLVHGRPQLLRIDKPWESYVRDPDATRADLEDAREVFWTKLVPLEALKAQYPEHEETLNLRLGELPSDIPGGDRHVPSRNPLDGYLDAQGTIGLVLWDRERQEARIVEAWFLTWEDVSLLVNKRDQTVEEIPDDAEARRLARALARDDPETFRVLVRKRRRIEQSVFLPAIDHELSFGTPYENDREHYPFVEFIAYREADELLGVVRNLKDPQREINKRRSAVTDMLSKRSSSTWFANRRQLENPNFLEGAIDSGMVGWLTGNPLTDRPVEIPPPEIPQGAILLEREAGEDLGRISGVNERLQGRAPGRDSMRKVALLQQAAQIGVSELFDNYRRARRLLWRRIGKRVQQVYTAEQVVGLESEAGHTEWVTLNQRTVDSDGHVSVQRDIPALRWDIEIAESPATPTARAALLAGLLEFAGQFPDYKDALADLILEASDLPNRRELVERVRTVQRAKGILPTPGGNGAPLGAIGVPPGGVAGARRPPVPADLEGLLAAGLPTGLTGPAPPEGP